MTERPWEIEAPSLAISIAWGDVMLHTAHLSPARSFYLGDSTADCVLPDSAIGPGRVPLILVERGAITLVLHPSMDPEGTIATPKHRARTVGDLARPGMAEPSPDIPGAFQTKLAPGTTAALSIGDFTIAITLETKAACAVAGHFHVSQRSVPFQIASAVLHLAAIGAAALFLPSFPRDNRDPPSDEQIYFIQQALARIDEKQQEELGEYDDPPPASRSRGWGTLTYSVDDFDYSRRPSDRPSERRFEPLSANSIVGDDEVNPTIDPRNDRYSSFAFDIDTGAYAATRRGLLRGDLPEPSSIRTEAFLNSFDYRYAGPARSAATPFAVHLDAAPSPFEAGHHLLRIGVQVRRAADGAPATVADDVKIQVDFQPDVVRSYRLLGFENRLHGTTYSLRGAGVTGELAAGHSVTAVYDVVLATTMSSPVTVRLGHQPLRRHGGAWESAFVMAPREIAASFSKATPSFRLAAAVTGFAEILRKSPYARAWRLADVERIAAASATEDEQAQELVSLIGTARSLEAAPPPRAWRGQVADASLLGF